MNISSKNPLSPAILNVNLSALVDNYRLFKSLTKAKVAGVIKANGYGCGDVQVMKTLIGEGCEQFFVATPEEGIALKAHAPPSVSINILGGVYNGAEDEYAAQGLVPVLNSMDQVERWSKMAKKLGRKLPTILHIDTGMNRLGLEAADVSALAENPELLAPLDLRYVMSHFACSDEKDHPMNEAQAKAFATLSAHFPSVPKSLSNSSGLFRSKDWHYDLIRPGYALYGGNPTPETINPVRSVVEMSVRIVQSRLGKKGEGAGYGASHVFEKDTKLATVSIGYADGFVRSGSNKASLFWNGQPCPIMGRVSMDLIIVDVSSVKDAEPQAGDWLEVIGPHQSVDDLATSCGTIGYEILTSLSRRATRIYTNA